MAFRISAAVLTAALLTAGPSLAQTSTSDLNGQLGAVIDEMGDRPSCPKVRERINGFLKEPNFERTAKTLQAPVLMTAIDCGDYQPADALKLALRLDAVAQTPAQIGLANRVLVDNDDAEDKVLTGASSAGRRPSLTCSPTIRPARLQPCSASPGTTRRRTPSCWRS